MCVVTPPNGRSHAGPLRSVSPRDELPALVGASGQPSYSCEEEKADGKGERANQREQVPSDAPAQGEVGKCEPMAFGCQDDTGNHDQTQSKDGKRKRQALGPGEAPGPQIHQIMKQSIQGEGDDQARWSWRKTPQRGKTEVRQKVAYEGIPVPPEASEIRGAKRPGEHVPKALTT